MTTFIQATNSIGNGSQFTFTGAGDTYVIAPNVVVATQDNNTSVVSDEANSSVRIDGALYGEAGAISINGNVSDLTIGENGIVASNTQFGVGISMMGTGQRLENYGEIVTPEATAVSISDGFAIVSNAGTISAGRIGVEMQSFRGQVVNSGLIQGGIENAGGAAILSTGSIASIVNLAGGRIIARELGVEAIDVRGAESALTNFGEITSIRGWGVDYAAMNDDVSASLLNHGTISGDSVAGPYGAFRGNASGEEILNTGTMNGNVRLEAGDDSFVNSGEVFGVVRLGSGDDMYLGNGGSVSVRVLGGAGADDMFGGSLADEMTGDGGADNLRGRAGDDIVTGGDGDDIVVGNRGDDRVDGNAGDDRLFGNRGDDIVRGGSGDDVITGGRGDDVLTGNSGEDIFVFNRRTDEDIIMDFQNNTDRLDLTAFGLENVAALRDAGGIVEDGAGSIIDLTVIGGDGTIYVYDMSVADWTGADFIL